MFRGFASALVIEHALQVCDDSEGVIELEDAALDVAGEKRGLGAAKVPEDSVVERHDKADGRSGACGKLLINRGWRIVVHFYALASCWLIWD
jgi:hypothetical protein